MASAAESDAPTSAGAAPRSPRIGPVLLIAVALGLGLAVRLAFREHSTRDTFTYLLPWYAFARDNGVAALGTAFTNYTPAYSYLLLIATLFDGRLEPLLLIKSISFVFELGCAILAWRIVRLVGGSAWAASGALCAVWLAPSVLYNGALWGQADSIWTFFVLLVVEFLLRGRLRYGVLAWAMALAVKLQAVFLGPLVFAFVLMRRMAWPWLLLIPATYVLVAVPVLLMGRPLPEVLGVYLDQSMTFGSLSMSAANPWYFVPDSFYGPGVYIGLTLAAVGGLAIAYSLKRAAQPPSREVLLTAAALSLLLMPFLLPKMHDRYFYAWELAIIILAAVRPKLLPLAVAAQLAAVFSYFVFDGRGEWGLPFAVWINVGLACLMILQLRRLLTDSRSPEPPLSPATFPTGRMSSGHQQQ